jgi:serine/threonine protein kinase
LSEAILLREILEGKYKLGGRLGGGNFGTVYKADELNNGASVREVALKLYSPEATKSGDIEGMFEDCSLPARILSSVSSIDIKRHFVQIFSWGRLHASVGECAYVSMELVKGAVTLEDLTERGNRSGHRPAESEVLEYMRQFFAALSEAHKADVLHRDIKGANVMVMDGVVKIVDFGMGARMSAGDVPLKTTMYIYAPENFARKYYAASDIYQAGLMFYKFWTGVQPFEKSIARRHDESDHAYQERTMEDARRMRIDWRYTKGSDIVGVAKSEKLDAILAKCLRFSENERYADATQILSDIKAGGISIPQEAFANRDFDFAENSAKSLLQTVSTSDRDKADLLWLLGNIETKRGDRKSAKDYYSASYKLADQTGVYCLDKPRLRELIHTLADCYRDLEQKGMENLYRKKASSI